MLQLGVVMMLNAYVLYLVSICTWVKEESSLFSFLLSLFLAAVLRVKEYISRYIINLQNY